MSSLRSCLCFPGHIVRPSRSAHLREMCSVDTHRAHKSRSDLPPLDPTNSPEGRRHVVEVHHVHPIQPLDIFFWPTNERSIDSSSQLMEKLHAPEGSKDTLFFNPRRWTRNSHRKRSLSRLQLPRWNILVIRAKPPAHEFELLVHEMRGAERLETIQIVPETAGRKTQDLSINC